VREAYLGAQDSETTDARDAVQRRAKTTQPINTQP
jgi:hypothetical protein